MCRHAGFIGLPQPIANLFDGAHGLTHQSYGAKELRTGVVCADGFGVGWYDQSVSPEPARYANPAPVWSDTNLPSIGRLAHARCAIAAVRNATVAGQNTQANCAPFSSGRYLFSLNGYLEDFPKWRPFLAELCGHRSEQIRGDTDGEWLFQALLSILDQMEPEPGALAQGVLQLIRFARDEATRLGVDVQLNILVTDGRQIVASRFGLDGCNSLYSKGGETAWAASEPFDSEFVEVPVNSVIVLHGGAPRVLLRIS